MKIQRLTKLDSLAQQRYIECIKNGIQFYYDKNNSCLAYLYSKSMMVNSLQFNNSEYYAIVESYNMEGDIEGVYLIPISAKQFMDWVSVVQQALPSILKLN